MAACPQCGGSSWWNAEPCSACSGTGRIVTDATPLAMRELPAAVAPQSRRWPLPAVIGLSLVALVALAVFGRYAVYAVVYLLMDVLPPLIGVKG